MNVIYSNTLVKLCCNRKLICTAFEPTKIKRPDLIVTGCTGSNWEAANHLFFFSLSDSRGCYNAFAWVVSMITGVLVLHQSWFQHQQVIMRMRLKLKTVFVLYFTVSLLGLIYALMQLGKTGVTIIITLFIHPWIVHFWASHWFLCAGQRCDCRDHDLSKDQQISQLRGELQKLQEHIKTSELSKKTDVPKIYVITPTYARYVSSFFQNYYNAGMSFIQNVLQKAILVLGWQQSNRFKIYTQCNMAFQTYPVHNETEFSMQKSLQPRGVIFN